MNFLQRYRTLRFKLGLGKLTPIKPILWRSFPSGDYWWEFITSAPIILNEVSIVGLTEGEIFFQIAELVKGANAER